MIALVDTNVLLRLAQPWHAQHSVANVAVALLLKQNADLCIVPQNLVEFWAVATRPPANNGLGMSHIGVIGEIRRLRRSFGLLEGGQGIADAWEKLVAVHQVSGKQAHDAHLVAAMSVYGVRRLITFNGDDFKRYEDVEIIAPASVTA